jgi:hypothetical protein
MDGKTKEVDSRIRVVVRCRPFVTEESRTRKCLQMMQDGILVGDKKFSFEHMFGEDSTQEELYEHCVNNLVEGCFQGFNGTVFACTFFLFLCCCICDPFCFSVL